MIKYSSPVSIEQHGREWGSPNTSQSHLHHTHESQHGEAPSASNPRFPQGRHKWVSIPILGVPCTIPPVLEPSPPLR